MNLPPLVNFFKTLFMPGPNQIISFPVATVVNPGDMLHIAQGGIDKQAPASLLKDEQRVSDGTDTLTLPLSYNEKIVNLTREEDVKVINIPVNLSAKYRTTLVNAALEGLVSIKPGFSGGTAVLIDGIGAPITLEKYMESIELTASSLNRFITSKPPVRSYIEFTTTKDTGSVLFRCLTNLGAYCVQWWDNTITQHTSNTDASKTTTSSSVKIIRVWAAAGVITNLQIPGMVVTGISGFNAKGLTTLNASSNSLTSFKGTGFDDLTTLNLSTNPITSVDLSNLKKLINLNLSNTLITVLEGTGLSSLLILTATNTQLVTFSGAGFNRLGLLELQNTPSLVFFSGAGMPALTALNISSTHLIFFGGSGLFSLAELVGGNITTLQAFDGSDLRSITRLELYGCGSFKTITNFPEANTGLVSSLKLNDNALQSATILALYNAVGASPTGDTKNINVKGNPGAGASTTVATGKGWSVTTT